MILEWVTYPWVLYVGLPLWLCICSYYLFYYRTRTYRYALTGYVYKHAARSTLLIPRIFFALRALLFLILLILIARPRFVDRTRMVLMQGIDIMVALDVSGSMQCFDDLEDRRSRIEVAKAEAARFIKRRDQDAIGLVLFAQGAVSRCPLTLDKRLLLSLVNGIELGVLDVRSTYLATGILTAANRLKTSTARSKIIILLTDGEPSEDPISIEQAVDVIKNYGIKVYTIGIGNPQGGFVQHPWAGIVRTQTALNTPLLRAIAQETGGCYFEAHNPQELRHIYEQIDRLERTARELPLTVQYHEWFKPLLWLALILITIEIGLSAWWRLLQ